MQFIQSYTREIRQDAWLYVFANPEGREVAVSPKMYPTELDAKRALNAAKALFVGDRS